MVLVAIEEAVALYRALATALQEAFNPRLAAALSNLSGCPDRIGRPMDGLAANEEAIALGRALAAARPEAFNPGLRLAPSLYNQSICLNVLERRKDASVALEEAVKLRRQLAARLPVVIQPMLAKSLGLLSNLLRDESWLDESERAIVQATS